MKQIVTITIAVAVGLAIIAGGGYSLINSLSMNGVRMKR